MPVLNKYILRKHQTGAVEQVVSRAIEHGRSRGLVWHTQGSGKTFTLDPKKERQIRKSFGKIDQQPKILIVTEKLLTGVDAPVLYAMNLDKPMRDHTLLQAPPYPDSMKFI